MGKLCEIQISVLINKAALAHNHTHSFTNLLWLPSCFKGRVERLQQRLYSPLWLKYSLSGPLQTEIIDPWYE